MEQARQLHRREYMVIRSRFVLDQSKQRTASFLFVQNISLCNASGLGEMKVLFVIFAIRHFPLSPVRQRYIQTRAIAQRDA